MGLSDYLHKLAPDYVDKPLLEGCPIPLRPEILRHCEIPKPLHGLAPRVVLGEEWWDKTRKAAYQTTNNHCISCGVPKAKAKFHQWMEAHEVYTVEYLRGRMTYVETVPLCFSCHSYIHVGRMKYLVKARKMEIEKYADIIKHGTAILKAARMKPRRMYTGPSAQWQDWRLVIDGMEYGPAFKCYEDWKEHFEIQNQEPED